MTLSQNAKEIIEVVADSVIDDVNTHLTGQCKCVDIYDCMFHVRAFMEEVKNQLAKQ